MRRIGALLGLATNQIQERLYARNVAARGPEARLYMPMFAAVLFPAGMFIYAWCTYTRVTWVALAIGIVVRPLPLLPFLPSVSDDLWVWACS